MSGKIVRTTNITQSAVGNKDGLWTTVFAAAVFINDENLSNETAKAAANNNRGSLQEGLLRQTVEAQLKNNEPHSSLSQPDREAVKSGIEQARPAPSTRKSLP
jgi:hypothetical protein